MLRNNEIKPMLTVKEVAKLLHVHTNTVRRWSDRKMIRAYRLAPRGDRRFRQEDITRFFAELNPYSGNEQKGSLTER